MFTTKVLCNILRLGFWCSKSYSDSDTDFICFFQRIFVSILVFRNCLVTQVGTDALRSKKIVGGQNTTIFLGAS